MKKLSLDRFYHSCDLGRIKLLGLTIVVGILLVSAQVAPFTSQPAVVVDPSVRQTGQSTNSPWVVDSLPPHQLESGLVTRKELDLTRRWVEAVTQDSEDKSPWLDSWLGTSLPFSFRYDGRESASLLKQWQLQKGDLKTNSHSQQREFVWTDHKTGLRLAWQLKRFTDYPAVEWVLTFENKGISDTPMIEDVQALNLRLNHSRKGLPYVVHGAKGGRSLPDDMMPFSWVVPSAYAREGKTGGVHGYKVSERKLGGDYPSSNRHLPFFNLETPEDRGVLVGVGWSGNWLAQIKVDGNELNARTGLKETRFILHPGEKVRTPRILLLFWEGKRLHGHNMLRQLLHRRYVPALRGEPQKPLVSVNVCFTYHGYGGFLHQANEQTVLPLVESFAKLGAELLIIDAGWYEGAPWNQWLGNWRYSKRKYPRGFRPISEALSKKGMTFGIWFAPEHVSPNALILKEHPEWVRPNQPATTGGTLRMELPEAREWFLKQVESLVEKEGMNCYRQDGAGGLSSEPDNRKGITEMQHIAGLYTMWDALKERYLNLIMEGCSGGGRRIDLETLSRFHWHQKSDRWYDTESDQCGLYGANLYLPGGIINIPTEDTDDYGTWSSFAGQFCLAWHPLDEDFPMERARLQVERYKLIRPFLNGDFYPLTPCSLEEPWLGYQFHRTDLDRGFALLFRRDSSKALFPVSDSFKLVLRGLEPQSSYRIRFEGSKREETLTGKSLTEGIDIAIKEAPGAELITYEPAK